MEWYTERVMNAEAASACGPSSYVSTGSRGEPFAFALLNQDMVQHSIYRYHETIRGCFGP